MMTFHVTGRITTIQIFGTIDFNFEFCVYFCSTLGPLVLLVIYCTYIVELEA